MPDHVSPDTGRQLREAGLHHEWQIGDWCCFDSEGRMLVACVFGFSPRNALADPPAWFLRVSVPADTVGSYGRWLPRLEEDTKCVWLPTTGQLLVALGVGVRASRLSYGWYVTDWRNNKYETENKSLPEALAEAWLRVQAQEVQA